MHKRCIIDFVVIFPNFLMVKHSREDSKQIWCNWVATVSGKISTWVGGLFGRFQMGVILRLWSERILHKALRQSRDIVIEKMDFSIMFGMCIVYSVFSLFARWFVWLLNCIVSQQYVEWNLAICHIVLVEFSEYERTNNDLFNDFFYSLKFSNKLWEHLVNMNE
jgi:hypothetical protein